MDRRVDNKQLSDLPPIQMGLSNLPVRGIRLNSTPISQNVELRSNIEHPMNIQPQTFF